MKTRIEDAAREYGNKAMGNMSPKNDDYGISHFNLIKGFIAGAEFMQKELGNDFEQRIEMEVKSIVARIGLENCQVNEKLKAQNEIMKKGLKHYAARMDDGGTAREALKKAGEV